MSVLTAPSSTRRALTVRTVRRFFPKVMLRPGQEPPRRANGADARAAMTRQNVTGAVKSVMEMLGVDSRQFSGKSMRRGGLSAAINA